MDQLRTDHSAFLFHSEIAKQDPKRFDAWFGCLSALVMNSTNPDEAWIHHPDDRRIETITTECLELASPDRMVDVKSLVELYIRNMEKLIKHFEPSYYPSVLERGKAYALPLVGIGSSILFVQQWFDMDSLILCFGALILAIVIWVSMVRKHVTARKESHPYPTHYQASIPKCKSTVHELKRILREHKSIR